HGPQSWDLSDNPLLFNEQREFTFDELFKPVLVGMHSIQVRVDMRDVQTDRFLTNNLYPRDGDPLKFFEVAYMIEAQVLQSLHPTPGYENRPMRLGARFRNNGVSDISNTFARYRITFNGNEVYNQTA